MIAALLLVLAQGASVHERTIVAGPDSFATVRHLVVEGTQREIGRALAELAAERHGWMPEPAERGALATRDAYFEEHAPAFVERMRGVADFVGVELAETDLDLGSLGFGRLSAGCTVVYWPPSRTAWGTGVVSRNYDFSTGTFRGRLPEPGDLPVTSQPYVLETRPDQGHAVLAMCAYDLLGGVIDGMNSEGLTIALLADDEVANRYGRNGTPGVQPGFGVLQIGRHVLETCATAEEARAAFRAARLYYSSIPCHYLVADRHGDAFVWENAPDMSHGFVFDAGGAPLVTTNFMLQLHPDLDELPGERHPLGYFNRFRTIKGRIAEHADPVDLAFVKETNRCVAVDTPVPSPPAAPSRTLWHSLWFPEERRLEVDFYLREGDDGPRRSEWLSFELEAERD